MNNRYLYRAKHSLNSKKWHIGNLVEEPDGLYLRDNKNNIMVYIQDQSTICQCTGLKDKNGKLIFENDIVKFDVYEYEKLVSSTVSEIKWCEELCSLSVVVNKQGIRGTLGHFLDLNKEVEVIGSAIDNPELLEK